MKWLSITPKNGADAQHATRISKRRGAVDPFVIPKNEELKIS